MSSATESASAQPRERWRERLLPAAAAAFIRTLRATLRLRHHGDAELRRRERAGEHFILAFWHCHLLLMPYCYRGQRISVLSSVSRDGQRMARTLGHFGISTARGSSSRGGAAGLRELVKRAREGSDIAFTPDGPRGPSGTVHPGVIAAAAMTGLPIIPVAYAATRQRRLGSWDRLIVPLPGARVEFVYGAPLEVGRQDDVEPWCGELARQLNVVGAAAVALAAGRSATTGRGAGGEWE